MKMKITDIKATNLDIPYEAPYRPAWQPGLVRNSRDFTFVRVYTDAGIVGYAGTDGQHAGTIARSVAPYLIGQDAFATEQHARVLRHAGGMWCVDLALWDIIGKAAGLPLYQLWGAARDKVQAYASAAELGTPENRAELAVRYRAEGFRAMKLRFHQDQMKDDLALFDRVHAAAPDLTIMIDANQATTLPSPEPGPIWDYQRALQTARELEQRGAYWLEMMYEPPTRTIEVYQQLGGILESTLWIDEDGFVRPPAGPGLGVSVNEERIARFAV